MEQFDVLVIGGGPGGYLCAERAAEAYLAGESNYLSEPTEQLEEALENLRVSAIAAKSASGYSRSLDFYSTLKRYNEIEVDPS